MACNNQQTIFWTGTTFADATQLFSDNLLTQPSPDGFYSFGGLVRQVTGGQGILGPVQPCNDCAISCASAKSDIIRGTSPVAGRYTFEVEVGTSIGAVVLYFRPSVNEVTPAKLTWSYNNITASEYSSPVWGYAQGILGRMDFFPTNGGQLECNGNIISNDLGSNNQTFNGTLKTFDLITQTFVDSNPQTNITLGPYNNLANGGVTLTAFGNNQNVGTFNTVIPKTSATLTTISITVESTCAFNEWELGVNCPTSLNSFSANSVDGRACGSYNTTMYTSSVYSEDGVSPNIQINDWVFTDVNGVTQWPAGTYPVLVQTQNNLVTVDLNGVVTGIAPCT